MIRQRFLVISSPAKWEIKYRSDADSWWKTDWVNTSKANKDENGLIEVLYQLALEEVTGNPVSVEVMNCDGKVIDLSLLELLCLLKKENIFHETVAKYK